MRSGLVLALSLLAACTPSEDVGEALRPSMSQLRWGDVVIPEADMPVLPETRFVIGIVTNSEDEAGYDDDQPPLLLSDAQMTGLDDLEDPKPLEKHASYAYRTARGDLYDSTENDVNFDDVRQGAIGDCYFAAGLASTLYADSERLVRDGMVRPILDANGDPKHYAVRFYDAWGVPQDVMVDPQLVRSGSGNPTYIRSADSRSSDEEWVNGLVEKAYAKWHGDYETIGNGGSSGDVLQALTGTNSTYRRISYLSDASLEKTIQDAVANGRPMTAGTFGEDSGVDYTGSGIYAWHAYTLMGVRRDESNTVKIQLRNPWGSSEPAGNGPDDGIFEIDIPTMRRLYQDITIGGGYRPDTRAPAAVTDLIVADSFDGHLVVGFTSTGDDDKRGLAASYDLRVSDAPITDANFYSAKRVATASPQAPGTPERVEIGDLTSGRAWYVAVKVEDESGQISRLSNVVMGTAEVTTPDPEPETGIRFDFEDGGAGWEAGGLFHITERWAVSPTKAFWMGIESSGNYANGSRVQGDLSSPLVDLSGFSHPILRFEQKLVAEPGGTNDKAWIEVAGSADGFDQWTQVWARPATLTGARETIELDLSRWAGQEVYVFWMFDSVDGVDNDFEGWFIDDVRFIER